MTATSPLPSYTLQNVRVFDGTSILPPDTLYISNGLISDKPGPSPIIVDCTSKTLLPGLIDSHVHIRATDQLASLASHGVTSAIDMACWPTSLLRSLREYSKNNRGVAQFLSPSVCATSPGSTHSKMFGIPETALLTASSQAESFVQGRIAEGADFIKIIADVPGPSQDMLDALVVATRNAGLRSVAHAARLVPFQMALEAGVDVITHAPINQAIDETIVKAMLDKGIVGVPTLAMMEAMTRAGFIPGLNYEAAAQSVRYMFDDGVPILAGTDANTSPMAPVAHGAALHHELELLVDAGMSPLEVLRAATSEPAKFWGFKDRGTISPGMRADLLLVDGDPLSHISVTKKIDKIWCGGLEIEVAK